MSKSYKDNETVIRVENISKSYHISHQNKPGYGTIKDGFSNFLHKPRFGMGKSNPENDETFWALKDINFAVKKGEVFGIVGKNGSGKSTMLKILSRIVDPTTGSISMHGRVASMLEVGTGFHPELTGRENIYFNGSMIGMSRQEIKSKFDDIVAFSEIEKFLDTPVKFYSSGMYVRLAFSVAAHLDPDILIIDEVLAVGDAQFQKKCLERILSGAKRGQTILFVSHSMTIVKQVCDRAMYLEKGIAKYIGETEFATEKYMEKNIASVTESTFADNPKKDAQFKEINIYDSDNKVVEALDIGEPWKIALQYTVKEKSIDTIVAVEVLSNEGQPIFMSTDTDFDKKMGDLEAGKYSASININDLHLLPGVYYLRCSIQSPGKVAHDVRENIPLRIRQAKNDVRSQYFGGKYMGYIADKVKWQIDRSD
ncbi:MAG: transporter ATP-binding protein [Candidatus Saccharibacteria bacterium]|nr:transporter ATP-binding protein [Candidatus Saccharibacteria bacterium]